jgi:hypothetical protein
MLPTQNRQDDVIVLAVCDGYLAHHSWAAILASTRPVDGQIDSADLEPESTFCMDD